MGSVGEEEGAAPHAAAIEHAIGHDLAITNLRPRLHLPRRGGRAQGPGFPNLSSLGLLADRVLGAYAQPPERLAADALREPAAQPEQRNHP